MEQKPALDIIRRKKNQKTKERLDERRQNQPTTRVHGNPPQTARPDQSPMKTLHPEGRPARARPATEPKTEPVAWPAEEVFTACELEAAEQLLHLSESSSSSGAPWAAGRALAAKRSSFSSPRSVNTPPAKAGAVVVGGCADWEEEEEHEVAGSQRRVKRYRLIAEIYAATEEIGGRSSRKNKKEQTTRWRKREEKDPLVINVVARG